MDHPFRSAAFGGFNRQDVLAYLENTAKENNDRQQQLQQQLDQARQTAEEQSQQLTRQREQLEELTRENGQLREQLAQLTRELEAGRNREKGTAEELARMKEELAQTRQQVCALKPDADAYTAVKERTAGVELEAHRRAQAIQAEARDQARQLHREVEQWFGKVAEDYSGLCSRIEATVSHAADQLSRAGTCLEQINVLLGEHDEQLESLGRRCAQDVPDGEET